MSDLTAELNLALAVPDDDTADYLTQTAGLRGSLNTLDGLFNSTTGHNHNGAHQGGGFSSLNLSGGLTVGTNLTVNGTTTGLGAAHFPSLISDGTLQGGATTLSSLTVSGTSTLAAINASGAAMINAGLSATGAISAGTPISGVGGDLNANRGNGQGYVFLANGSTYLGFDGTNYQLPSHNLYVNGDRAVTETATQTLSNKTLAGTTSLTNPTISGAALSGTLSGTPTWASPQTFPYIATNDSLLFTGATNAQIRPSTRSGHPSAELELDNYLYVIGDVYAGLRMYAISFNQTSDPRLKANMTAITDDDCMGRVRAAVPVQTYQMGMPDPEAPQPTPWEIGFSAPDVYATSPEFVTLDDTSTPVGINYANMAAMLWGALRQLDGRCQAKGI